MPQTEILTASRFYLELKLDGSNDALDGVFMDCKGFKHTQEIVEVCEVTPDKWSKATSGRVRRIKVPGNVKVNNIVLRRGMSSSQTLWQWFNKIQTGKWAEQRRSGSLTIYDQRSTVQARFEFEGAWPANYNISDLNAASNDYEIEELELACEGFKRVQ